VVACLPYWSAGKIGDQVFYLISNCSGHPVLSLIPMKAVLKEPGWLADGSEQPIIFWARASSASQPTPSTYNTLFLNLQAEQLLSLTVAMDGLYF
jgi:hypothetical protein